MKTYIVTLLMLLMSIGTFAQDDEVLGNYLAGRNYLFGINGVSQDFDKAVKHFSIAANSNDIFSSPAVTELGYCYFHGLGVPQNRQKAVEYFLKAAPEGDEFAQLYLSYFYRVGQYVKKDKKMSDYWADQCSEYFTQEDMTKYITELFSTKVRFMNIRMREQSRHEYFQQIFGN